MLGKGKDMTKQEVLMSLCSICHSVMDKKFDYMEPADCFCVGSSDSNFQFSPKVLDFIRDAVREKLERQEAIQHLVKGVFQD